VLTAPLARAQVADFGTVRIGVEVDNKSHITTKEIAGTKGYMPPEYTMSGHVSEKTDSFAFGMVLLELLAGRPPRETAALYTMEPGKRHSTGRRGHNASPAPLRLASLCDIATELASLTLLPLPPCPPRAVCICSLQISSRRWRSSSRTRAPASGHAAW
jgi:serine/threonine protein kinase